MQIGQGFIANSFKPAVYVHDDTKEYRMLFKHHDGLNASCLIKPLNKSGSNNLRQHLASHKAGRL